LARCSATAYEAGMQRVIQDEDRLVFIFDDRIEREAWNDSNEDRVVLMFDISQPELCEQERRELTALLGNK